MNYSKWNETTMGEVGIEWDKITRNELETGTKSVETTLGELFNRVTLGKLERDETTLEGKKNEMEQLRYTGNRLRQPWVN